MNKTLRSRKGAANVQGEMITDSTLNELSRLVKILGDKIDKLGNDSESRHDVLYAQLKQLESTTASLNSELNEIKQSLEFTNNEVEKMKENLSVKADNARVATLEKKLDDLENRSKRNNIVIWNIPEGAEKDTSCQEIVSNILSVHMQLEGYLLADNARSPN